MTTTSPIEVKVRADIKAMEAQGYTFEQDAYGMWAFYKGKCFWCWLSEKGPMTPESYDRRIGWPSMAVRACEKHAQQAVSA